MTLVGNAPLSQSYGSDIFEFLLYLPLLPMWTSLPIIFQYDFIAMLTICLVTVPCPMSLLIQGFYLNNLMFPSPFPEALYFESWARGFWQYWKEHGSTILATSIYFNSSIKVLGLQPDSLWTEYFKHFKFKLDSFVPSLWVTCTTSAEKPFLFWKFLW